MKLRMGNRKENWDRLNAIIDRHLDAYPTYPINRVFTRIMSKEAWASWKKQTMRETNSPITSIINMPQIIHKTDVFLSSAMRGTPPRPFYAFRALCGQKVLLSVPAPKGTQVAAGQGDVAVHCATCFKDDHDMKGPSPEPVNVRIQLPEDGALSNAPMFDDKGRPLGKAQVEADDTAAPLGNTWGPMTLGDTNKAKKTEDYPYGVPPPRRPGA